MTEDFKRKLTAILSADVVGYSRLMGDDEASTVKTLETYKGVMSSLIKQHRGRVVDSHGDNLLAEFGSVVDAVQCAVSIQKELQTRNADLRENRRMEFRIGINLGDVIEEENRIYGDGVNIAARLEALADPGGICISKTAFDYIENKLPFGYSFIGEQTVKNIAKPIGAYKVLMETRLIDEEEKIIGVSFWNRKAVLSFGIIVILVIVAVLYLKFYNIGPPLEQNSIKSEQEPVVPEIKEAPKTIAVLPFDDISPEKDQGYFVDGLSEEILNAIDQIPGLTVKARTSSFFFKDQEKTVQEIAGLLGVDHIMQGSVRKSGDTIRVTARLIRVADVSSLWSETYNRELKDIFKIQEDIANNVANKLKLTLEAFQLIGGTDNIEAYELYLVAKGLTSTNLEMAGQALEAIDAAIELDPEFALAYAEKAGKHYIFSLFGPYKHFLTEKDDALKAAQKSIELEPNLYHGYVYLGYFNTAKKEWIEAEPYYQKALELIGESLSGDHSFIFNLNIGIGKLKSAYGLLERMRRNDPLNQRIVSNYYVIYMLLGDRQRAEEEYQRRNKLLLKGLAEWHDDAITEVRLYSGDVLSRNEIVSSNAIHNTLKEYFDSPEDGLMELRRIYSSDDNLSFHDLLKIASWARYFGYPEFEMEVLDKLSKINANLGPHLWYKTSQEIRKLPRFKEYVKEVGLVDYWEEFGWPDLCHPVGDDDFVCE